MKDFILPRLQFLCLVSYLLFSVVLSNNCTDKGSTFIRRLFSSLRPGSLPPTHVIRVHESPPSECFGRCSADDECSAYFVDYRNSSCLLVRGIGRELRDSELVRDEDTSYHRKVCLHDTKCDHEWAFDEVQGVQLFHYLDKSVPEVPDSTECMDLCLAEDTFVCRSAKFDKSQSDCVLSQHDRRTASEVFRQAPNPADVVYLERQCVEEPTGCLFRRRHSRAILRRHMQVVNNVTSREACEEACLHFAPFACRSYEFGEGNCLLSPEDFGDGSEARETGEGQGRTYFEKESCVDVEVKCGPSAIQAVVRVSTPFRGRVYAAGHPYDCYSVSVEEGGRVTLSMPLHSPIQCGTRNLGNGTFVNSVVVQHHAFVLRTTDRRIDVACDYEEMKLKIRGSKGIKNGEMKPLAHTVTAVAPTPGLRLRVVNATDHDVKGVELGDPLFLKVELEDESIYGIFGSDLVAKSSSGSETVLLIDEKGCPVEPSVFQALDKLPGSKSLVAPFQAFKFAADSAVQFQMTVSYCLDTCPPAECEGPGQSQSYGKKRRRKRSFLDLQSGDVISDVTMESPTFLVTSLKPTLDTDTSARQHVSLEDLGDYDINIKTKNQGLCVSVTTLYIMGGVVGSIQVIFVCVVILLFFYKSGEDEIRTKNGGSSSKSWPSISSRRKLVCSNS
ncbi:hypothetical protein JTE90_004305 [Oedothorax gibbosus]|uniref:Uncharacterized protein n=1 Tax=Oedothorax gibbosus TaxID=931172 RepID=A0AAV6VN98_9ARAC|nr:hypothetical protein JTE90_004305 [Oedothorax gibbosus]